MANRDKHVIPKATGGWSVRQSGAARASKTFISKKEAVKYARDAAKRDKTDLVVHKKDGRIAAVDSYGSDPFPPRNKKS